MYVYGLCFWFAIRHYERYDAIRYDNVDEDRRRLIVSNRAVCIVIFTYNHSGSGWQAHTRVLNAGSCVVCPNVCILPLLL